MTKSRKINILLTTVTSLNIHHLQLGLYNIQAYFFEKMKRIHNSDFIFDIKVIHPKKWQSQHDFFPKYTKQEIQQIACNLMKSNPSMIGFSCYMWNIDCMVQIAKEIKKKKQDVIIVFGGPEVSYQARELLKKFNCIDIVAINDGEEIFFELVQFFFLHNGKLETIKGIAYQSNNNVIINPGRETDLAQLPSPYLSNLIDIKTKERSSVVETLRGCPFRCAYCSYHLGSYGKVRFFPIDKVNKELQLLLQNNIPHIIITDDNFNINEERALKILHIITKFKKKSSIDIFLNIYIRKISRRLVNSLARAQLFLSIGIQTVNSKTLKKISRHSDISLLEENLSILKKKKLLFDLQFIIGLPGDTFQDFKNNLEWGLKFHPYKISFFPLAVMHGTQIYHKASSFHIKYENTPPYLIIKTDTFSHAEIVKANRIFDAINLLYNLGLLKKSLVYMRERLGIDYFTICDNWNKIMHNDKLKRGGLPTFVLTFITKLLLQYNIPMINHIKLSKLIKDDLSLYYARHYIKK